MNLNPTFPTYLKSLTTPTGGGGVPVYLLARVTHVVRGPFIPNTTIRDEYYDNPTDIGIIKYDLLNTTQDGALQSAGNPPAKPFYSAIKQYPVEGEFVLIFQGPSIGMNESKDSAEYYYLPPFNLWNASHHNAFPNMQEYSNFVNSPTRNYESVFNSNQPNNVSGNEPTASNYPLGPNFPEKDYIRSLEQFVGDTTIEGRWGNSIRFGSTTVDKNINYWSSEGEPGLPITIIRNGQGTQENDLPWFPTIENINRDPSSIYLTNGQKIVVNDINNNFSLASLGTVLERTITVAIPIQQQLTSIDTISPLEQDKRVSNSDSNNLA